MNFKKPFKVLTTAALIGTLSLSAVAPGASASSLDKKVSAKAETKASVENVVLKNKAGELLTLPLGDYLEAKAAGVDFDGAEPVSISTNGKYYSLDDYLEAKASTTNKTEEEAFKLLGGNEQDIKPVEGQINKDGSVTPKDDAPAEEDFKVTEVAAITTTGVDVKFPALKADIKDVTVEVKNSKGETVAVKAENLKKGATTASFDFTTAVAEADLTGKWTVDGQTYDFGDLALVEAIIEAAKGNSDVLFVKALNEAGIKNIDEDVANGYKTAVKEADPEVASVADVQKLVDAVNAEYSKVKAVVDAAQASTGKELKVYNALKAGFENVEADYSKEYLVASIELANESVKTIGTLNDYNYTGSTGVSYKEIQDAINRVNFYQTAVAVESLWNPAKDPKAADITKAKALVEKYAKYAYQEEDEFTAGQYLQDSIKEIELLTNIDKATTKAAAKAAIEALVDFDAELPAKYVGVDSVIVVMPFATGSTGAIPSQSGLAKVSSPVHSDNQEAKFEADEDYKLIDANLEAYIEKFDKTNWSAKNSREDILNIIKAVNVAQSGDLIAELDKAATVYKDNLLDTAKKAEFLKALKATGVKKYADANATEYATKVSGFADLDANSTIEDVQALVDAANLKAVNTAATANNGSATVKAIQVLEIKKLDVIAENKAYYLVAKTNDASKTLKTVTTEEQVSEIVKAGNKAANVQAQVEAINAATTAAEVKAALDELSIASYVAVPSADREYVAGLLLEKRDILTADRKVVTAAGNAQQTVTSLPKAKAFYNVDEVTAYFAVDVTETAANIDFDGDKDKATSGAKTTSVVNQRTTVLDAINSVTSNVPSASATFEALVATTAEAFKDAEVTGFSKEGNVTAAESAKAEAFLDSDHFYTAKEAADLAGVTAGDAKGEFRNVTDALAYFK